MNEESPLGSKNTMMDFSRKSGGGFASFILWITFLGALAFVGVIYYVNYGMEQTIAQEREMKVSVDAQLNSPQNIEIEAKANSFKDVFSVLQEASVNRMPKKELLDDIYKYFTKDVKVKGLSLGSDGYLAVDGYTASYRKVADFMKGISMSDRVSNVVLKSASENNSEGVTADEAIVFSVTAKIDMTKKVETDASDEEME